MRETSRSLGAYFVLVGLFYLVAGIVGFCGLSSGPDANALAAMALLVVGGLGLAYMYVGVYLKSLLASKPATPLRLAVVGIVLSALRLSIFNILINVYIWYQLKRLATEAAPVTEGRTLD